MSFGFLPIERTVVILALSEAKLLLIIIANGVYRKVDTNLTSLVSMPAVFLVLEIQELILLHHKLRLLLKVEHEWYSNSFSKTLFFGDT